MRKDIIDKKDLIKSWIDEELPKCEIAKRLGCKQDTLNSYLIKFGIVYKGQRNKKGQHKGPNKYKDSSNYTYNGSVIPSHRLKEKLIFDSVKPGCCEKCGARFWLGKRLPLELHHKDGNHHNNELSNLEILCPNCHSVSGDNSGAAVGNYTK